MRGGVRVRCVFYLRLSREDGTGESDSIQNQRLLLQRYLTEHEDMTYAGEWADDGFSGSNYDRPAFQAMMREGAAGGFDCILCKDLSRLGREYIQTGYFLREIFPKLGIRFIAVADHYDSASGDFMEDSLLLPVMNLMNDAYCRDISKKVRWQQRTRRALGEYIGAFACYGYRKCESDIHRLEIDEAAAEVVRVIYWLRLSGMTAENIASVLNKGQIRSPYQYKLAGGSRYRSGFAAAVCTERRNIDNSQKTEKESLWTPQTVRRILSNEMYTGVMIQGKDRKISYKLDKRIPLPEEQWARVEEGLPVIIPKWIFDITSSLRGRRVRCRKGQIFCDELAGYGLTGRQQNMCGGVVETVIYDELDREKDNDDKADTIWQKRLLFVLMIQEIKMTDKSIFIRYGITKKRHGTESI